MLSMLSRLREQRWWRVLAVAMLVPVVVFSNPLSASAASSGTMTFGLEASGLETGIPGIGNTTCQLPWSVNATGMVIGSSARCDGGPDYSPGHCQPFEGACGSYGLVIRDTTGATMGSVAFDPFDIGGGVTSVKAGLGGGFVPLGSGVVAQACLSYYFVPAVGGATDVSSCIPISVDKPETPPPGQGDCVAGFPEVSHKWVMVKDLGGGYAEWDLVLEMTRSGAPLSTAKWFYKLRFANNETVGGDWTNTNQAVVRHMTWSGGSPKDQTSSATVEGVELYAMAPPGGLNVQAGEAAASTGAGTYAFTIPTTPSHPFAGITQREQCRFWYGKKKVDLANTTIDEPVGSIPDALPPPPPPAEPPPAVVPVDDTPDTDSGILAGLLAMLRAILAVLGSVWDAIKGLATAIVDGVRSMLSGLFLPSDGFIESKWAGVDSKWQGTSPGRYMSALDDFSPGTVSGCAGLPLDVDLGHGIGIHEHIGGACSGAMASAASVTRVVITAVFAIAGAVACVRAVGAGLGWDPGIGRGGAA